MTSLLFTHSDDGTGATFRMQQTKNRILARIANSGESADVVSSTQMTEGFSSHDESDTYFTQRSEPELEASLASFGSDSFTVTDEVPRVKKDAQTSSNGLYLNANQTARINSTPDSLCQLASRRSSKKKKGKWI
jgi:hypothetical protein